jgi:hypothetical protein
VYYAGFPVFTGAIGNGTACSHPENGVELVQYFSINSTDTQAALWKSTSTKELILSIPGTSGLQDIFTDLELSLVAYDSPRVNCTGDCKVHQGLLNAWNSLEPAATKSISDTLRANPGYNTILSGHSLGAGIAGVAFASLKNGPYRLTEAYTYGQPRTGNQEFANYVDSISGASEAAPGCLYRVTHFNDGIPQLPPTLLGYRHSRTEYWESAAVANESSTYRCDGQEPSDCNNSVFGLGSNAAHTSYAGFNVACG